MEQKSQIIYFIFVSTIILLANFLITLIYSCKNLNKDLWQYNIFDNRFLLI